MGAAFVVVEEERVRADVEGEREGAEDVEGGLAAACLIAPDLGDVGAGAVGELLLGERLVLARAVRRAAKLVSVTGSLPGPCSGVAGVAVVVTIGAAFKCR